VRQDPQALCAFMLAQPAVLADRVRDGVVEAQVEHLKIGRSDRRRHLDGQLGDRLADAPVVMNDLGDGEATA